MIEMLNFTVKSKQAEIDCLESSLKVKNESLTVENISTQTDEVKNYEIIAEQLHKELVKVKNELLEMNKNNRNLRQEQRLLKGMTELGIIAHS